MRDMSAPDPDQPVTDAGDAEAARSGAPPTRAVLWFRSVVAHAPDLLAVLDRAGVVKYVSPSAEPLLGYSPDDLAGQTLAAFSDLDVAPIAQALHDQPGVPIFIEGGLRHRDGTMRSFEGNVTNLLADPIVQGFVVNARDVTDRREAEAARRRSEMALRAIVQASPVAILALDRRGHVHVWNVACEQMFGWTAADVVGGRRRSRRTSSTCTVWSRARSRGTRSPGTKRASRVATDKWSNATWRSRRCATATGGPVTAVLVVADVTEQKRAQRAVEASEARFRSLVQHLTDMILVLEDDGTIAYVSPSASAFLGRPADALVGSPPPSDLMWPEDVALLGEMFQKLRASPGASETITARLKRADGEFRSVEMIAVNQLHDPAVHGIVTNCRDITDRVDADAAIRASEERLQALVASASDVISVIDADGKLRYSSSVTTHVLGYPEGAGYGEHILDVVHPEDRPAILDLFETRARSARDVPAVRGAVAACRQLVDVRGDPRQQPARRPVGARHRRDRSGHHRAQAGRGRAARERAPPSRRRGALPRRRRRPDRARLPLPPRHDAHVRQPAVRGVLRTRRARVARLPSHRPVHAGRAGDRVGPARRTSAPAARCRPKTTGSTRETGPCTGTSGPTARSSTTTARSSSSSRSDATSPTAARAAVLTGHQAEILEQVARACRSTRPCTTIARTVEDHFPRLVVRLVVALRRRDDPPDRRVPEPAVGLLGSDRRPAGRAARALERDRGVPPFRDRGLATSRTTRGGPSTATSRTPTTCAPRGRRRSSRATGTRCSARSTCTPRVPQSPDSEHEQILSLLAHLASIAIERKAFEDRLAHQSMHDPLTGLPNRLLFLDRLSLAIARCKRTHREVAVLFLDLDRFKNVNDSLGHDAGDELLMSVARRLESVLRPGDTVARFGGDEFTVLCDDLTPRRRATERSRSPNVCS